MVIENTDFPDGADMVSDALSSEKNPKSVQDEVRAALENADMNLALSGLRLKEIFDAPYHSRSGPPAQDLANSYHISSPASPVCLSIGKACVEYVNWYLDDAEPEAIYMFITFLLDTNLLKDYPPLLSTLVVFISERFPTVGRYWELMKIFINEEYASLWWARLPPEYPTRSLSKGFYDIMVLFHDVIPEKVSIQDLSAYRDRLDKQRNRKKLK